MSIPADHGERYWLILQNNIEWLRFSETKASIILTSYGVLFTIFYTNANSVFASLTNSTTTLTFVVLFGSLSLISIIAAILAVRPRLRNRNPTSILYFRHIQEKYTSASEYKRAAHSILDDEDKYTDHLTEQIHSIAKVTNSKYICTGISVWCFGISLLILVTAVIIYFISNIK
ncbi:Pycsar system effector family protein [Chitinophaga silvatica]|uniref:Pycsar system effector family protein n=1 Tax=Chitinophaga silvatica TaxID=2282649 RepID=UPI000E355984|nr:Pycsar system effector family protein [Chitinophaga silvatica]